ncbi:MAG: RNA polymerase sigma factor [Planctomycetota bacterium]
MNTSLPDELAAQSSWMRRMALALVRNDADADDAVQDALCLAVRRPPVIQSSMAGWLKRVLRNLVRRTHRRGAQRTSREQRVALPEHHNDTPDNIAERVEFSRVLAEEIAALPHAYRQVVVLRFFEGIPAAEVSLQLAVPAATVRTRLRRALARLREQLELRYSKDGLWTMLLPLVGVSVLSANATAAGATASGTNIPPELHANTLAATRIPPLRTRYVEWVLASLVVASTGAYWLGRSQAPSPSAPATAVVATTRDDRTLTQRLSTENALLRERLQHVFAENQRLNALARHSDRRDVSTATPSLSPSSTDPELVIAFEPHARLPELRTARWTELAQSALRIQRNLHATMVEHARNLPATDALEEVLRRDLAALSHFTSTLTGKLPSHAPQSGEFWHPIVIANLLAAMLSESGLSLSREQIAEYVAIGAEFEQLDAERIRETTPDTPRLVLFIEELELRQVCCESFKSVLTDEQKHSVYDSQFENRFLFDLLSPLYSAGDRVRFVDSTSTQEATMSLKSELIRLVGPEVAESRAAADYWTELQPLLEAAPWEFLPPSADHVLAAGQARARLWLTLAGAADTPPAVRTWISRDTYWPVPRVASSPPIGPTKP